MAEQTIRAAMPRQRTRPTKVPLYARLTLKEVELLRREKSRRNLSSMSVVVEEAVRTLFADCNLEREGLRLPAAMGEITPREYMVMPETLDLLEKASATLGFRIMDILRAAVDHLHRNPPPAPPGEAGAKRPAAKAGPSGS